MKNFIIYKIFLLLTTIAFSQQKGIIYYGYIEAIQMGNANGPDYNAYMVFNKLQSYYVTAKDSLELGSKSDKQYRKENGDGNVHIGGKKSSIQGDQILFNSKNNTIFSSLLHKKQLYIKENATKFNWKISLEVKKIGKFNCNKATTKFRGRNYIAWFTKEIPIAFGPWKLNGLPGLILEAYDTEKNVYWYFKNLEYPTKNKQGISNIRKTKGEKNVVFIEMKEYYNYQKEFIEKARENNIILQKKFPNVTFGIDPISEIFVEFE